MPIDSYYYFLDETDSTMDALKHRAQEGAPEGTVVVAERQTRGRGKQGRVWFGDSDSLMFSILYRPEKIGDVASWVHNTGIAVIQGIQQLADIPIRLEWPNDLIIDQEKIGGILIETSNQAEKINYVMVGIGLNVNNMKFPESLTHAASSLAIKTGHPIDKKKLLVSVVNALNALFGACHEIGGELVQ